MLEVGTGLMNAADEFRGAGTVDGNTGATNGRGCGPRCCFGCALAGGKYGLPQYRFNRSKKDTIERMFRLSAAGEPLKESMVIPAENIGHNRAHVPAHLIDAVGKLCNASILAGGRVPNLQEHFKTLV